MAHKPGSGKPPVARSRSQREEESIYNRVDPNALPAIPTIKTYIIEPPSPTGASASAAKLRGHADSSQMQNAMHPVMGPRDAAVRAGTKPFNHARSNVSAIREASQLNALRKMSAAAEPSAVGRPGIGLPRLGTTRSPSAPSQRPQSGQRQPSDSGAGSRNFMQENKCSAGAPAPRPLHRTNSADKADGQKYLQKRDYGQVPQYLINRKIDLIEQMEEEARAKEAALVPPGMRMLPEQERLETLAILQRNRTEIERAIQGLPLRIETVGQIKRKNDLDQRLREIEDAFKIFSRPKVVVHM